MKARREVVGLTQERLAEIVGASVEAVRSWEGGWSTPSVRYRAALADALHVHMEGLDDLIERRALDMNGHEVPGWLSHYHSLVHAAGTVARLEKDVVPGLLQTKAYAAGVERADPIRFTDQQVIERVDVRLARQRVLDRKGEPLALNLLLSEGVLRNVVGDSNVMAEQLDHLLGIGGRPSVDLRVLPANGCDSCSPGGFELLSNRHAPSPFMVCTFDITGPDYEERPEMIRQFVTTFDHLTSVALHPSESTDLIREIRASHQ
jgi:transcriptional regulator with XRE-family HTH domain